MLGGAEVKSRTLFFSRFTTFLISGFIFKAPRLTEGVNGKGRIGRRAERSSSSRITGSDPKFVLRSFNQSSHL